MGNAHSLLMSGHPASKSVGVSQDLSIRPHSDLLVLNERCFPTTYTPSKRYTKTLSGSSLSEPAGRL